MGDVRNGRSDDDLVTGIDVDEDLRRAARDGGRAAADAVRAVLADLDRRWKVPPTVFAREFAMQMIEAVLDSPAALQALATLVAREIVRAALAEPRLLDEVARRLRDG